jgi:hypothetical protein
MQAGNLLHNIFFNSSWYKEFQENPDIRKEQIEEILH